jgi:protein Mpv17
MLKKYPLVTKGLTCGIIAGGGDATCQMFLEDNDPAYDPHRTIRFAVLGTFFVAPTNHIWYQYLAKHVAPGKTWTSAITRTVLDQFTWTRKSQNMLCYPLRVPVKLKFQ